MSNIGCKESQGSGVNFKSSRSILNALKNLFKIPNIPSTQLVDSVSLAFLGSNKPGLSVEKTVARIINAKSEAGLRSGPLDGGSPAPDEIMEFIRVREMFKSITEEMRMDVCTRPGSQVQATGASPAGPVQVFGQILTTACGHGQAF